MSSPTQDPGRFWQAFANDPRLPDHHGLRAGDRDRDLIRDVIAEGFADGRLTDEEMNARLTQVDRVRVLGELLPVVSDLIRVQPISRSEELARVGEDEIERQARISYADRQRKALGGMLVPSLICLTIWIVTMVNSANFIFPWPLFVILGTGSMFFRLTFGRESMLEEERRRLRRDRDKELEKLSRRETEERAARERGDLTPPAIEAAGPQPSAWQEAQPEPEKQPNRDDLR